MDVLKSPGGIPGIGPFDGVYREVSCKQGRPDFIALRCKIGFYHVTPLNSSGIVEPSILSLLKPKSARTFSFLVHNSEFSELSIKRSLKKLLDSGYIKKIKSGSFILNTSSLNLNTEVWAFELKLNNAKRAIFQSQQSRAFADRSIIIVPPGQEKNYIKFTATLKRWGIGLATYNPLNREFTIIRRSIKSRALSRIHQIYAMTQALSSDNKKTSTILALP